MIIAIDGPAASGKSTTARLAAQRLGFTYLDTGAMYRTVTLALLQKNISFLNIPEVENAISKMDIQLSSNNGNTEVNLNGIDVTNAIRTGAVTGNVSTVSAIPLVRKSMVKLQRQIGEQSNCVVEGRDIGTVVFPNAKWKFFIVADTQTRAIRRQKDLAKIGEHRSIEDLEKEIELRDMKDSTRDHSPLRKAKDAIDLDTSSLTIDEQVSFIIQTINPEEHFNE
ncbi:MAG: (d)CMP kinase [Candidatus Marinimicrobia bacterium]|nr:(d)CMP kinase [Candidatus Neomarinimicrobiota bacterium]